MLLMAAVFKPLFVDSDLLGHAVQIDGALQEMPRCAAGSAVRPHHDRARLVVESGCRLPAMAY